jgi:hypothetical protein
VTLFDKLDFKDSTILGGARRATLSFGNGFGARVSVFYEEFRSRTVYDIAILYGDSLCHFNVGIVSLMQNRTREEIEVLLSRIKNLDPLLPFY